MILIEVQLATDIYHFVVKNIAGLFVLYQLNCLPNVSARVINRFTLRNDRRPSSGGSPFCSRHQLIELMVVMIICRKR